MCTRRPLPLRTAAPSRAGAARLAVALTLALGALGSGCSDTIPPAFEIEGRRMVVIPLRDALQNHYFSPRGNQLTRSLTFNLERLHQEEPDDVIEVVPFDELVAAVGREDPTAIRPEDMAKRVRATCFLMGSITRFDTRLPGDIGIARGRAEVQIKVFDTDRPLGRELLDTKIAVSFPPEGLTSLGVLPPSEVNEKDIENGLYAALVDKLSKLFRYHEPEKRDR